MEFYGLNRDKVVANCDSLSLGRADRDTSTVRGWNRIRPEHVVDLLDQAAPDARIEARNLATLLERMAWRILVSPSPTANNRLVNNTREITLSTAGRSFVLQCTESPSLKLERITA